MDLRKRPMAPTAAYRPSLAQQGPLEFWAVLGGSIKGCLKRVRLCQGFNEFPKRCSNIYEFVKSFRSFIRALERFQQDVMRVLSSIIRASHGLSKVNPKI